MKKTITTFLFFSTFYLIPVPGLSKGPDYTSPNVTFAYAKDFDEVCNQQTSYSVREEWKKEFHSRQEELVKTWESSGVDLLTKVQELVGKPFVEKDFLVTLSLCSFPSMSTPLLVNARYWLKSFTPTPIITPVLVSTVFHEVLHRYLENRIPKGSKLIAKYKDESETVLTHLHLFAIQKAVYLELGQAETLTAVVQKDQSLPNPSYSRTWQIVNDLEPYKNFVAELK